jgi:hypothetical protein
VGAIPCSLSYGWESSTSHPLQSISMLTA